MRSSVTRSAHFNAPDCSPQRVALLAMNVLSLVTMRPVCFLIFALSLQAAAGQTQQQAPADHVDALLSAGIAAQRQHDYKTAIEDYRKALALQPGLGEARANLGAALAAAGDFDAAIEEDTRALQAAPNQTAVRSNLALAYYKKGDMAHAHTEFETVHAARPTDVKTAVLLGYTDIKLDKEADAASLLAPLEPGHESDMDFQYVLGLALVNSGREADGLPRLEKAAGATRSVDAYFVAGNARMRRSEFREARADADAGLAIDSSFPGIYTLLGQACDAMGDSDASVPAFEAALRVDPRDANANLYMGVIRLKQRNFESARPLLDLALTLRPGHPLTRLQLAKLDNMTGKYAEAAATLEDLERTDPNWLEPHVELATIYYKLHRPEDGQRERDIVQKISATQQQAGPQKE
jgi:tetratricopeptide (TPR) repeat protein